MKIKKNVVATKKALKKSAPVVAQAAPVDKATRNGVNIGKRSGLRVMAYQDHTLAINDDPKRRLTDTELAADWRAEFPNSRAVQNGRITEVIVRGVRNLFNQGTGGHGTAGKVQSSKPYVAQDGKRVISEYVRAKKVVTAEPEAAPATAKVAKTVKVQGKVVARRKAKIAA